MAKPLKVLKDCELYILAPESLSSILSPERIEKMPKPRNIDLELYWKDLIFKDLEDPKKTIKLPLHKVEKMEFVNTRKKDGLLILTNAKLRYGYEIWKKGVSFGDWVADIVRNKAINWASVKLVKSTCPECKGKDVSNDGNTYVCLKCGLVYSKG